MSKRKKRFPRTDAGNAEMFAESSRDDLRYDHRRNRWLVWQGNWWSEDVTGFVVRRAVGIARYRAQAAQTLGDDERKKEISWALQSESLARLEAMISLARSKDPVCDSGEGWDSDPILLGVANGVVDLRSGKVRSGQPSDKITLHSNISFNPAAGCPRWFQFLSEIFGGDEAVIDYVQRAVGYCLTGDVREQCLFLLYGIGANGKSTFLRVLLDLFSAYAFNLPFSAFELKARSAIPHDIAAIAGKRLVTAIETSESAQLNEARIKALTGGDEITARHLYHEFFTFSPAAKFWLAVNHLPSVADDSPGFWRRIRLIPFLQRFDDKTADKDLLSKLKAEAPGILNWAIQGCLKWQESGLGMPPAVQEASEAYRQESDPLADFIEECCEVGPSASVSAAELWQARQVWESGNPGSTLDRLTFSRRLEARGFKKVRHGHKRTWTWMGIGLKGTGGGPHPGPWVRPLRTDADVNSSIVVS